MILFYWLTYRLPFKYVNGAASGLTEAGHVGEKRTPPDRMTVLFSEMQ
jgi:hypothetical protein